MVKLWSVHRQLHGGFCTPVMCTRCGPLRAATSGIFWQSQVPHTSSNHSTRLVIHSEVVSVGLPRADGGVVAVMSS